MNDAERMHGFLHHFARTGKDPIQEGLSIIKRIPFFGRLLHRWFVHQVELERRRQKIQKWDLASDLHINDILHREQYRNPRMWVGVSEQVKEYLR